MPPNLLKSAKKRVFWVKCQPGLKVTIALGDSLPCRRRRRLFSSAINFAAVPDTIDAHNPNGVGNFVNYAVIAHANAPVVLAAR